MLHKIDKACSHLLQNTHFSQIFSILCIREKDKIAMDKLLNTIVKLCIVSWLADLMPGLRTSYIEWMLIVWSQLSTWKSDF